MVTIDMGDIEEEITYWSSAMICFVLGANPPLPVMSGFCNRIWGKKGLEKVSMVGRGLLLVRFNTLEQCDKALAGDPQFFDSKPLIMKRWNPDIELHKENVKTVPIWIRMPNLELKYWGQGCLHKLGDIIGTTLKVDNVTLNKDRLAYARILVEVELDKELPDYIRFQNEKGILIQQYIE
ncbi:2 3-bisphosphoglycerate-independent phosphoglycerate mutase [Bienertia sinuspersici]